MNRELSDLFPPFAESDDGEEALRGLTLAEGILLLVLGLLSLAFPILASVWVTAMVAIAFLVGGLVGWVTGLSRARRLRWAISFWRLLVATLFVLAGGWMLSRITAGPMAAATQVASLALAIGLVFLVEGGVAAVLALSHRQVRGWGWGLANGLVTLILGGLILSLKATSLIGVLGLLVGISFLFSGIDLLTFSASFHSRRHGKG
ncbi:MAG: HdeD family acid-resistance protein [Cyanobium sp.]